MKRRKIITSFIMAVAMGVSAIIGNVSVSSVVAQTNSHISTIDIGRVGITVSGEAIEVTKDAIEVTGEAANIESLFEPVTNLATEEVSFSYIYFGSYPQSEVTGEALTEEIINAEYVSGEAVVGGVKYRKLTKEEARTFEDWKEEYATALSQETMDKEKVKFDNWDNVECKYFRYEPIKWKVMKIEGETVELMSEMILDEMPYDTNLNEYRWKESTIHSWLNEDSFSGFYGMAFDKQEKENVIYRDSYEIDYVLLSSCSELWENIKSYDGARTEMTDYAFAKGGMVENIESRYGQYWLIESVSPGYAAYVRYFGEFSKYAIYSSGQYPWVIRDDVLLGVVPRITINLTNTTIWKNAGSDPIVMAPLTPAETIKPETSENPTQSAKPSQQPAVTIKPIVSEMPSEVPSGKPVIKYETGDVNQNGWVELDDAQLTLKVALKIETLSETQIFCADVDKDGEITLTDAQKVLRKALKIE